MHVDPSYLILAVAPTVDYGTSTGLRNTGNKIIIAHRAMRVGPENMPVPALDEGDASELPSDTSAAFSRGNI